MLLTTIACYALGQLDIYVMEHVGDEREVGMLLACAIVPPCPPDLWQASGAG